MKHLATPFFYLAIFALSIPLLTACGLNPQALLSRGGASTADTQAVATTTAIPTPAPTAVPEGFVHYRNAPNGYELIYPSGWRDAVFTEFDMIGSDEAMFDFNADPSTISGTTLTIVSVIGQISTADYEAFADTIPTILDTFANIGSQVEILTDQEEFTFNGYPATKTVANVTNEALDTSSQSSFIVIRGEYQMLLLTVGTTTDVLEEQATTVEQIFSSVRLSKPQNLVLPPLLGIPASRETKSDEDKPYLEPLIEPTTRRMIDDINVNSYVASPLNEGEALQWTFSGTAGQVVDIELLAFDGVDPVLDVIGPDNLSIFTKGAQNLSYGTSEVAYQLELPADGIYIIEAFDVQQQEGVIDLRLLDGGSAKGTIQRADQPLALGEKANLPLLKDEYGGAKMLLIPLRVTGDTIADIEVATSETVDIALEIRDENGTLITDGLIDRGYTIESINALQFPEDGTYTLFVRPVDMFNDPSIRHRIEVSFTQTRPNILEALQELQANAASLTLGSETENNFIQRGEYQVWAFEGTAGTTIEITSSNQTTGLIVDLIGTDGRSVLDGGQSLPVGSSAENTVHNISLPETGTYLVTVRPEFVNNGGMYRLYVGE